MGKGRTIRVGDAVDFRFETGRRIVTKLEDGEATVVYASSEGPMYQVAVPLHLLKPAGSAYDPDDDQN